MANFKPLKDYILYCVDELIEENGLKPPFLDVGCGSGDVSKHLGQRNWDGVAIDFSEYAVRKATDSLSYFPNINVRQEELMDQNNHYSSVFLLDVLEHIHDDNEAIEKISSLLKPSGHLVIVTPSNPNEWRWDDEYYGHYRRYSLNALTVLLRRNNFSVVLYWDVTYPVYWLMRRIYTRLLSKKTGNNISNKTKLSSLNSAWDTHGLSSSIFERIFIWDIVNKLQFRYYKGEVHKGHEILILAKKDT